MSQCMPEVRGQFVSVASASQHVGLGAIRLGQVSLSYISNLTSPNAFILIDSYFFTVYNFVKIETNI